MGKRKCSFNSNLQAEFPYLQKHPHRGDSKGGVFCKICRKGFSISNSGRHQIIRHSESTLHKENEKILLQTGASVESELEPHVLEESAPPPKKPKPSKKQKLKPESPDKTVVKQEVEDVLEPEDGYSDPGGDNSDQERANFGGSNSKSHFPHLEPFRNSSSPCFICEDDLPPQSLQSKLTSNEKAFLFKDTLRLVGSQLQEKILLCRKCLNCVQNGCKIQTEITKMEEKLKQLQSEIFWRVSKKTFSVLKDILGQNESNKRSHGYHCGSAAVHDKPEEDEVETGGGSEEEPDWIEEWDGAELEEDEEEMELGRDPPPPPPKGKKKVYYCGLCEVEDADKTYETEEDLKEHTNQVHYASEEFWRKRKDLQVTMSASKIRSLKNSEEDSPNQKKWITVKYSCPLSSCAEVKDLTLNAFAQHLAIHQRRPHQCNLCREFLPYDETTLKIHLEQRHSTEGKSFEVFTPVEIISPGAIWKCLACLESFQTENERNLHAETCPFEKKLVRESPSDCRACSKSFKCLDEWRLHRILEHPEIDRMSCFYCDKSFSEKTLEGVEERHDGKLHAHIKTEHTSLNNHNFGGRFYDECESCGVVFTSGEEMKEHFKSKHGVLDGKCYICRICGHAVTTAHNLRHHLTFTHFPSEDSTICDLCGAKFVHGNSLIEHKFQDHGGILPEGTQLMKCPVEGCGFKCIFKEKFRSHAKKHSGIKLCGWCGKGLKAGQLARHEKIHKNQGTRPFKCQLCESSFAVKDYLRMHMRMTHEKRPFPSTGSKKRKNSEIN